MEKEKIQDSEQDDKKKKGEEKLPFCTTAPSPEHVRGQDDDEPCDDGRSGALDED